MSINPKEVMITITRGSSAIKGSAFSLIKLEVEKAGWAPQPASPKVWTLKC